jgi:O-antigen ligase
LLRVLAKASAFRRDGVITKFSDIMLAAVGASLPWSTTMTGALVVVWLLTLAMDADTEAFGRLYHVLRQSICVWPVALGFLIFVGIAWSGSPWSDCLKSAGAYSKLLTIPLIVCQFQRSGRGFYVFSAFVGSCVALLIVSWLSAIYPSLTFRANVSYGVPVKSYIDQSQEFLFCATALAWVAMSRLEQRLVAIPLFLLALVFVGNMLMINVSRTSLFSLPIIALFFAFSNFSLRRVILFLLVCVVGLAFVWPISNNLRTKVHIAFSEFSAYRSDHEANNVGARLEFWRRSIAFISEAPLLGNGTGSTERLFKRSAEHQSGIEALITSNPHNQVLNVGVQVGIVGIIVLLGMWSSHFLFFRMAGLVASIGSVLVIQNIISSIFNSHIVDFTPGWMYVLGVGVASGCCLHHQSQGDQLGTFRHGVDDAKVQTLFQLNR